MNEPYEIKPDMVFDRHTIYDKFGIASVTLEKARASGKLRYTRKGNRTFYLGKWILEWIERDSTLNS